jgi:hypothetical protein
MKILEAAEEAGKEVAQSEVKMPPVTAQDVLEALAVTKPSASMYKERYEQFERESGSHM